jgi:outer membrane protein TolC
LRMSAFQRSLLRTRDSYLDALLEVAQAEADLAAAVGDPGLALNPGQVHK